MTLNYPKPGPVGGGLIRRVIRFLRDHEVQLPLNSHILIATSGGVDSVALALLVAKYGRKIIDRSKIRLLHINHGWRGKESDEDALFVENLAQKLNVPFDIQKLNGPPKVKGGSWENEARIARKQIFLKEAARNHAVILTAHQGDDLAETILWRFLTGSIETHVSGIAVRHGVEIRPFLTIRKKELVAFLEEEKQTWREDSTNHEQRFLRSRMRQGLIPIIEELFPKSINHLMKIGLKSQLIRINENKVQNLAESTEEIGTEALFGVLGSLGMRLRRTHLEWVSEKMKNAHPWKGKIDLPAGWTLFGERQRVRNRAKEIKIMERWLLEREQSVDMKGKAPSPKRAIN